MRLAPFKEAQNQYLNRKSSIVVSRFHRDSSISFHVEILISLELKSDKYYWQ